MFNDKFTATIDYFDEKRTGIYMVRNYLPQIVGLNGHNPAANVGAVSSKGFDGHFSYKQRINDVNLTVRGNITYSKNEVLERDEENNVYAYQMQRGYRVDQCKGLIAEGLFKDYDDIRNSPTQSWGKVQPGDIKYRDVNGDGVINDGDQVAIGATSRPNLIYGLGASASWKGLDVNVHFQGAGKSTFFTYGKCVWAFTEGEWGNIFKGMLDNRWVDADTAETLGIPANETKILEMNGKLNMMKGAIETATRVSTVSPSYAAEIKDPWFSWGLHDELNLRHYKLCGIKNGIDTESYNPETDYQIYRNYSKDDMSGKGECKRALQERLCLEQRWDVPMVGMVTRLVGHKGLDLVRMGLEELMNTENMQFVILGSGDKEYEDYFNYMQAKYPGRLCFCHGFVPELARKIYSGADIFLMPSAQEPCGLAQMIALRYGTIPVVREVGGLKDSVFDSADNYGNGFTFKNYDTADMVNAVRRALWGIHDDAGWHQLMWRAMMSDNSWDRSANDYINVYNDTLNWA